MRRAADEPLRWIAENGGAEGTSWSPRSASCRTGNGYNAATEEYGDLLKQGVVDPVKVTGRRCATRPRSPSMVLTTATLVVEKKVVEADEGDGHSHGGHGHGH